MEPDHSGSIRLIKQHYPEIIIVGNKQTFGMIEGFYGVTGEQYLVRTVISSLWDIINCVFI